MTLTAIAANLDAGSRGPAVIGRFRRAYRSLAKLASTGGHAEPDPLDVLV